MPISMSKKETSFFLRESKKKKKGNINLQLHVIVNLTAWCEGSNNQSDPMLASKIFSCELTNFWTPITH